MSSVFGDFFTLQRGNTYKSALLGQPGPVLLGLGSIQRNGGFKGEKLKTYGGHSDPRILLVPGDIYVSLKDVTQSADLLGAVARVPAEIEQGRVTQDTVKLVFKEGAPRNYLYWLMRTPQYRAFCKSHGTGTTNLGLPREDFLSFSVPEHTPEREQAVETIQLLEDKIELNRRMNETLEEMARALFRDWFVDFGPTRRQMEGATDPAAILGQAFPPEKAATLAPLFPAKLGADGLPEGWKTGRLADWATSSPKTVKPDEVDPDTNYIGLEHMPRRSIALGNWETAEKVTSNKAHFSKGQVLFGKLRPYFHKVGIAPIDGICSTDIVVVDGLSKSLLPFVATLMSSDEFVAYTNQSSTGTKMPRTSWKMMRDYYMARPPLSTAEAFGEVVQPMHDKIMHSLGENNALAEMRDLLLPHLMSGDIKLSELANG